MDTTARGTRSAPITALDLGVGFVCGLVALAMWSSVAQPRRTACAGVAGWTTSERAGEGWTPRGLPCRGTPGAGSRALECSPEQEWDDDDEWDEPSDL